MYLWDAGLNQFLKHVRSHHKTLLYIVDLPLEQSSINGRVNSSLFQIEGSIFRSFDKLCVFNANMKDRIRELYDIPDDRFVEFEMLDYGIDAGQQGSIEQNGIWTIAFTGNLDQRYIGEWPRDIVPNKNIIYEFFGPRGEWTSEMGRNDVVYKGILYEFNRFGRIFVDPCSLRHDILRTW